MDLTIKVNEVKAEDSKVKAFASVVFDGCFKIGNISIMENKDGNEFVSMPRYKTNQVDENGRAIYQDICFPITKEFREQLYGQILDEYKAIKEKEIKQVPDAAPEVEAPKKGKGK